MVENHIAATIRMFDKSNLYCERVIYIRGNMSVDFALRWRWFFEYLAALVKVRNPHRRVELSFGNQGCLLGDEWREYRTACLLRHRKNKLKNLLSHVPSGDLFGFSMADYLDEVKKVKADIKSLEDGSFPIPDFPEYRNEIKSWL